jgi:hypothetical protein
LYPTHQINPNNAVYRYNCGNAYWRGRMFDQAVDQYTEAIRLLPNFSLAYVNRALAEAEQRR